MFNNRQKTTTGTENELLPIIFCPHCHQIPIIKLKNPHNFQIEMDCRCSFYQTIPLKTFLNQIKSYTSPKKNCEMIKKHNYKPAKEFCYNCSQWICEDCISSHKEIKDLLCHKRGKIEIFLDTTCKIHPSNVYDSYCKYCNQELCSYCRNTHERNHEIIYLNSYLNEKGYQNVKELIKTGENFHEHCFRIYNEIMNEIELQIGKLQSAVSEYDKKSRHFYEFLNILLDNYNTLPKTFYTISNINFNSSFFYEMCKLSSSDISQENIDKLISYFNNNIQVNENTFDIKKIVKKASITQTGAKISNLLVYNKTKIISSSSEYSIDIYNYSNDCISLDFSIEKAHLQDINYLSQVEEYLASCSSDNLIKFWKIKEGSYEQIHTIGDHFSPVYKVISISNKKFASCGEDGSIIIWNSETFEQITELIAHNCGVVSIIELSQSKNIISSGKDNLLCLWNMNGTTTNNLIKDIPVAFQNTLLEYKNVILVGGENSIKIVSIRTFDIINDIQNKEIFSIHSLMIIKDICVIGYNTKIQCINLKEYEILHIDDKNNLALGCMKQLDENSFISTIKNEEIVVWKY